VCCVRVCVYLRKAYTCTNGFMLRRPFELRAAQATVSETADDRG